MGQEKLLTVRDVSIVLGVSEREVLDMAESGQIPAYKVGGVYLRFKKEQIDDFRKTFKPHIQKAALTKEYSLGERIGDFFYFNDFYILSALAIILIIIIIFRGY